jgi:hypothetical protein
MIGSADRIHVGVAWPPCLALDALGAKGRRLMLRIGFRYDRNWRGYIFPTVDCKREDKPLHF